LGHTDEVGKNKIVRRLSRGGARAEEIVARSANAQGSGDDPSVEHATAHDASVRRGTVDTCNYHIAPSRRRSPKLTKNARQNFVLRGAASRRRPLARPSAVTSDFPLHPRGGCSRRLTFFPPRAGTDPLASPERPRVTSAVTPVARAPSLARRVRSQNPLSLAPVGTPLRLRHDQASAGDARWRAA